MSHFTCLVIGADPEEALAPYDENIGIEPYKAYWDSDEYERWEKVLQQKTAERRNAETQEVEEVEYPPDQVLGEKYTLEDMRRVYMKRFYNWDPPVADTSTKEILEDLVGFEIDEDPGVDDKLHIDDGGIYEWSTYNPQSKWDWWQVGGRWAGFFKLKEHALAGAELGRSGTFDNEPRYDADVALKGDVDIEWMRNEAGRVAGETWDRVHAAVGHLPEALPWDHFVEKIVLAEKGEGEPYLIEQARQDYHAQERVIAYKEWNDDLPDGEKVMGWFGPNIEEFQCARDDFVQRARDDALCPYSYIYEGEWHAPGKMGWFGSSSDTTSDRRRFAREFNELLDSLPDDTLLTLCDLHI